MGIHVVIGMAGKVIEVRPVKVTAKGPIQEILVKRPKFVHGAIVNDLYPILFFGNQIDELKPEKLYGKWININVYINGKSYPDEEGNTFEKVVLSVKDLKVLSR